MRARFDEMERLRPGGGPDDPGFWDTKASRFARRYADAGRTDPLVAWLRDRLDPADTLVDVGAGVGRFSLTLAPLVGEVVAVDPSQAMLDILAREAEQAGLGNVRCSPGRWPEVEVAGDVVLCSYVLPVITHVAPFCRALDRAAARLAVVYVSAASAEVLHEPFWRHFHGQRRAPMPSYLDAVDVLVEAGFDPAVTVVEAPTIGRFSDLDEAVADFRDNLLLADTPEIRERLAALLDPWLVSEPEGLRAPVRTMPGAILSWSPSRAAGTPMPGR